jgi:hypothetical protein
VPSGVAYFDGYLTEINFVNALALTPSSFGEASATTGVWQPIRYAGTYGTNGFYLPFTDNSALTTSSNVGLGRDYSGNGNYWTTNNISITAGSTYDSMTDVPTLTSTSAANYCVLNPLRPTSTAVFANGNLTGTAETGSPVRGITGSIVLNRTGKWYAEVTFASSVFNWCGVTANDFLAADINTAGQQSVLYYASNGTKWVNGTSTSYGTSYTTETIGIAFDGPNNQITFYRANVSQGVIALPSSTVDYVFCQANAAASAITAQWNFGQRPFAYTPPTGFVALNTFNLPTPTIGFSPATLANKNFDVDVYTGTGVARTRTLGFQPDLIWNKIRSQSYDHNLQDAVRGTGVRLISNLTNAELSITNCVTAFNSNGYSVGNYVSINGSGESIVNWAWKGGNGTVTNTAGSITSQVSANTSAGFSVVTFTTNNTAGATIGHGLGVAPAMIIMKYRGLAANWVVYHKNMSATPQNGYLNLNTTSAYATSTDPWNNTAPTSSVITMGAGVGSASSTNYAVFTSVAYCFSEVAGYSAFGSYTGNGSANGPFVFTGFRPRFVMIKATSTAGYSWTIEDAARSPSNASDKFLFANLTNAENSGTARSDFLSNGFKIRDSSNNNDSGVTYVYMAFAESPFKYANAR